METQYIDVIYPFLQMSAEAAPQQSYAVVGRRKLYAARSTQGDRRTRRDDAPMIIRADHPTETDREFTIRRHNPNRRLRALQLPASDEEVAHHRELTRSFGCLAQQRTRSRLARQRPVLTSFAWVAAILAIVGVLTGMLILGIAVSV